MRFLLDSFFARELIDLRMILRDTFRFKILSLGRKALVGAPLKHQINGKLLRQATRPIRPRAFHLAGEFFATTVSRHVVR
jgi:hypothetical protein